MNTRKKLHTFWQKLTFLGVGDDLSIEDAIKTRLLNIVLFIGIIILTLLSIRAAIVQEMRQFTIIFSMFFVLFGILFLNVTNRQHIARLIIIFGVTIPITGILIFIYPSPWELEFIYLMVIFVNLIFFQGRKQVIIVLFVISMFVTAHIIEPKLPMEYKLLVPLTPNLPLFLFVFFVLYSVIVLTFYQSEIKKYQDAQKETINALEESNLELKLVSEELERFIYIVSADLKNRLKRVQHYIKKVRKKATKGSYESIHQPLDNAESTARQMHFWVNDILEFSMINKSGRRSEEVIEFDALFLMIKEHLSDNIDNIEHRIIWTKIPNLRLNQLEAFIVFYNILKMSLRTIGTNVAVRVVVITTNLGLNIQFICPNNNSKNDSNTTNKHKMKLCELIVDGWDGNLSIGQKEKHSVYEMSIPKDKIA